MALTSNGRNPQADSIVSTRRPVPIIDPSTKQTIGISADISPAFSYISSSSPSVNVTRPSSNTSSKRSHKTIESSWKPDVHVRPFIPRAFTAINSSPAILINSKGVEIVRFKEYTQKFAGEYLLPEIATPPHSSTYSGQELLMSVNNLNTQNYGDHLLDSLLLDLEKQSAEIHMYDLYGVSLKVSDASQDIYKLHVPGIREGFPTVAYGDHVMLRQLRLDPHTSLPLGMETFFARGGESDGRTPAPGFSGYQINAVVVAVAKSVEDVFLRVNGILPERLVFNVCFAVQIRNFQGMRRAIGSIRDELIRGPLAQGIPSSWLQSMLFPSQADGIWQTKPPSGKFRQTWFDSTLNYEQKVSGSILSCLELLR